MNEYEYATLEDSPHSGLIVVLEDYTVKFYNMTNYKNLGSIIEPFNSVMSFQKIFAYGKFYYQKIK